MLDFVGVHNRRDDLMSHTLTTINGCFHTESTTKLFFLKNFASEELNKVLSDRYEDLQYRTKKKPQLPYNYQRVLASVFDNLPDTSHGTHSLTINTVDNSNELRTRLVDMTLSKLPRYKNISISTISSLFSFLYSPVKITANIVNTSAKFCCGTGKLTLGVVNCYRDNGTLFFQGGSDIGTSFKYAIGTSGAAIAPIFYFFSKTFRVFCPYDAGWKHEYQGKLGEVYVAYYKKKESDSEEATRHCTNFRDTNPEYDSFLKLEENNKNYASTHRNESQKFMQKTTNEELEKLEEEFRQKNNSSLCQADERLEKQSKKLLPRALLHGNGFIEKLD